jgi:hypothetical protein
MATVDAKRERSVAQVDQLIDENGQPIALPENSAIKFTENSERTVGATGPTGWWRMGLIGLGIVAAILLLFQLMMGNPGTGTTPVTPAPAPQQTTTQ